MIDENVLEERGKRGRAPVAFRVVLEKNFEFIVQL